MENKEQKHEIVSKAWYDRYYKLMLLIPVLILVGCIIYLASFYNIHGDFILKDASLAGGSTITIQGDVSSALISENLKTNFPDINVRTINDLVTNKQIAVIVDSSAEPEVLREGIEKVIGYKLNENNSTIEFTGPSLSENFYKQLVTAIIISFILMSIVIFIMFRTFVPSMAVIFAAFADIVMAITFVNLLGIKLSAAGLAAFLMLIGYSVDTDILLTTRVLRKKEGNVNDRIFSSFKTGMFMTVTGLAAVLPAFFIVTGLPDSFRQIFLIVAFGLFADIINTWLTNASIIKWYAVKKGLQ